MARGSRPDPAPRTRWTANCGIPAEWSERVFQQGFSSKRDSGMSGLGLGLATCKSIVETMGGSLGFTDNGPEPGCTFRVALPPPPGA